MRDSGGAGLMIARVITAVFDETGLSAGGDHRTITAIPLAALSLAHRFGRSDNRFL
jgi:hypothetical protein